MEKRRRIFITGIAGMIGFHTAKLLSDRGWYVSGIDNFNDYYDVNLKRAREDILKRTYEIEVNEFNIKDENIAKLNALKNADVVLHLAAYANPRHSLEFPNYYIDTNISGTQNLINIIEKINIPTIYASSSCVMHGQPLPWKEKDRPQQQNNPYGWSKHVNECQFMHSAISNTIGLRFFTVYGPYGRPDMALFKFTHNIVNEIPIDVFNYGKMYRDFTYVDDICQGIEIVANAITTAESSQHEIYNIGFGEKVNLMDFIEEIEFKLGKKAIKNMLPPHPADVPETWSDTRKLQSLGYCPTTSVKVGVGKFIEWYKHFYSIN